MKVFKHTIASALGIGCLLASGAALASSHREAPAISDDPAADNTDVWAWVDRGAHQNLTVVASYIPLEEPSGGPNFYHFSDDVLYEVHITRGGSSLDDVVTYQIRFSTTPIGRVDVADMAAPPGGGKEFFTQLSGQTQTYSILKIQNGQATTLIDNAPVAPVNIGPRSHGFASCPTGGCNYDDAFAATFIQNLQGGGRSWVGPRDDGFYVDLGGVFDLANLRGKGMAQDGVAGYNAHTIALEIPTTQLTEDGMAPGTSTVGSERTTLGVWCSAARKKFSVRRQHRPGVVQTYGPWVQVSRLGLPLVNEVLIGLQDKNKYNATRPTTDLVNFGSYFLNPVIVRDAEAVGIYHALGVDPNALGLKFGRMDIVEAISLIDGHHNISAIGDVLRVDMSLDNSFPNGRAIPYGAQANQEQADVTDVLSTVILAKGLLQVKDNVDYNDKNYLTTFPYLALPWAGFDQGHGKPTP
jgi:hypothetical protein